MEHEHYENNAQGIKFDTHRQKGDESQVFCYGVQLIYAIGEICQLFQLFKTAKVMNYPESVQLC